MNINKIRQYLSEAKSPPWYMGLHKSQKGVFFRGEDPKTRKSGAGLGALGVGIYLTWSIGMAKAYARLGGKGVVVKFKVPANLKIADAYGKDMMTVKKKMGIDGYSADPMFAKALTFELKRMGYDGVVSDKPEEGLVIFDHASRKVKKIGTVNEESNPRIPRKKGQPANSKKHSDLYTDENLKDTIHGLGFKDVATAEASVKKIENSGRSHAHKIQAAVAMEQRAREMGKTSEAAVYRKYIDKMKKKTKEKNK